MLAKGLQCKEGLLKDKHNIEELVKDDSAGRCVMVRGQVSEVVFGYPVPQKGVDKDGYVVARLVEDIKWLGYTNVILKSDNEPGILKLL